MYRCWGMIMTLAAACFYGGSAIVIKLAYFAGLQPAVLLPLQNMLSLALMWPLLLLTCGWATISRRQWLRLIILGVGGNLGISVCYFWSAQRIDVSLLGMILFTYPGFVLLYQVLFSRRQIRKGEAAVLALAILGMVLALNPLREKVHWDMAGVLLALGGALCYAFMNAYGEKLTHELPAPVITAITGSVSTLGLLVFLPVENWLRPDLDIEQCLLILASGLLSMVLPMNLMYLGIRRIGAFAASMISIVELPCTLVLACLILNEKLVLVQLLGGAMILLSVVWLQRLDTDPAEMTTD